MTLLRPFGALEADRRGEFAQALAQRPRRRAVLGQRLGRRLAAVAGLDHAGARRRVRVEAAARRAVVLRLGRRPDLDRAAAVRTTPALQRSAAPRRRPAVTPRSSARPPPSAPRSTCSSRSRARSPASPSASRRASIPRACSTPAACGRGCDANQFLPRAARRSGHRGGRTRFCAPACIAASARRPARPMCCSATSSIRRAAAST